MRKQVLYIVGSLTEDFGAVIPKNSIVMDNTTKALYQITTKGTPTSKLSTIAKTSLVVSIPVTNVTDLGNVTEFADKLETLLT